MALSLPAPPLCNTVHASIAVVVAFSYSDWFVGREAVTWPASQAPGAQPCIECSRIEYGKLSQLLQVHAPHVQHRPQLEVRVGQQPLIVGRLRPRHHAAQRPPVAGKERGGRIRGLWGVLAGGRRSKQAGQTDFKHSGMHRW